MKAIIRNGATYFPMDDSFASALLFGTVFQIKNSSKVYRVNGNDFKEKTILAFNIEENSDVITIPFTTPVKPLRRF
jgi:hypothetical protein